jgi:hypothetical protein
MAVGRILGQRRSEGYRTSARQHGPFGNYDEVASACTKYAEGL